MKKHRKPLPGIRACPACWNKTFINGQCADCGKRVFVIVDHPKCTCWAGICVVHDGTVTP